jgi:hypothetical protein
MNPTTIHRCEVTAISPRCNYVQVHVLRWTRVNIYKDHTLQGQEGTSIRIPEERHSPHLLLDPLAVDHIQVVVPHLMRSILVARLPCDQEARTHGEKAQSERFLPAKVVSASSNHRLRFNSTVLLELLLLPKHQHHRARAKRYLSFDPQTSTDAWRRSDKRSVARRNLLDQALSLLPAAFVKVLWPAIAPGLMLRLLTLPTTQKHPGGSSLLCLLLLSERVNTASIL